MTGLSINKKSFSKLKKNQQMELLFENTESIKKMLTTVKFSQKINYAWLSALSLLIGLKRWIPIF